MPGVAGYETTFAGLEPALKKQDPAWVHELRRTGLDRFRELGFPTLKEEEWRFTRTRPIAEMDFAPAQPAGTVREADIVSRTIDDSHCHRLVFVNGRVAPSLARGETARVWMGPLPKHSASAATACALLGNQVDEMTLRRTNTAFWATACTSGGRRRRIGSRCTSCTSPCPSLPAAAHPRLVVVADRSASVTIGEPHRADDAPLHQRRLRDGGDNASITHWKMQRESTRLSTSRSTRRSATAPGSPP
jgi:Fe-S cluster assembly protein SufD